jgi:glycosyltransferase involved in cell wall biosynthesis
VSESPAGLVSVVIAAYNAERFLEQAISSVLRQAYEPIEVIVVDDGSTDSSGAIARGFSKRVTCLSQENAGLGPARNAGIKASRGEFLAFLDADDLWPDDKLAAQQKRLAEEPDLECVFGLVENFYESDALGRYVVKAPAASPAPSAGSMLIRRVAFMRVGFFSTERRLGDFVDWFARALDAGLRYEVFSTVMLRRRVHGENMTVQHAGQQNDYLRVLKAALDRRRSAQ